MSKFRMNNCFSCLHIVLYIICINNYSFTQSKKEQIQILSNRLDSLKTVQSSENLGYNKRKTELESSIANSDKKTTELLKTLSTKKESLQNQISENKKLDQDILALKLELKTIQDSIQKILDEQPIKLLESSLINVSNEELIRLMNVRDEDLGEAFVNPQNPEIKPAYEIIGKQLFMLKGKVYCIVVMGVTNPNTLHVYSGTNYLACFEVGNDNWKLLYPSKNTEFIPAVGFGYPASLDKFIIIGERRIAVILEGGYAGMGTDMGNRVIYGFDHENKFHLIFEGVVFKNDHANRGTNMFRNIDDEYDIEFKKSTSSKYFDLIETKKSHGKKVKTTILNFNENLMKYE
jgi:hypothetical protein